MMATLNRQEILKAEDLGRREVEIPEWGGRVYIKTLTAQERFDLSERCAALNATGVRFMTVILVGCLVDQDGRRILDDDDVDLLAAKAGSVVQRLFDIADELNGFTERRARGLEKN